MKPKLPVTPFQWKGFRGEVLRSHAERLPEVLESLMAGSPETGRGIEVKRNLYRTVYRIPNAPGDFGSIYFKRYRFPRPIDRFKYFFRRTRAKAEWEVGRGLLAQEIPTLKPLCFGEKKVSGVFKDAFFISQEIPEVQPLDRFLGSLGDLGDQGLLESKSRELLFKNLARFVALLHERLVHHGDFHKSNLLARRPDSPEIFLVDLHRASLGGELTDKERILNLSELLHSLRFHLRGQEMARFLKLYQEEAGEPFGSIEKLQAAVARKINALESRQMRSRDKRCLVRSSVFDVKKTFAQRIYRRREFEPSSIEAALRAHKDTSQGGKILKEEGRSKVTRVLPNGGVREKSLCVKEIQPGNLGSFLEELFRGTRGKRAWFASHSLRRREVLAPTAMALVEDCFLGIPIRSTLIMEYIEGTTDLLQFLRRTYPTLERKDRFCFLQTIAQYIAKLHSTGLYHYDLQVRNLLVQRQKAGAWKVFLIDLESLSPSTPLTLRRRLRNLMQLNDSPRTVTRSDRMRFLKAYEATAGVKLKKEQIQKVIRDTQARQDRAERIRARRLAYGRQSRSAGQAKP